MINHDKWIEQAKSNASAIEDEIERLKSGHWNLFKRQYREFWAHAKEISSMFKTMKPLLREDREKLWAKFSSICEDTKKTQEKEKESRRADSNHKRDLVESKIREAHYQAKGARSNSDLSQAKSLLNEALQWIKDGWGGFNAPTQLVSLTEGKLTKEDRDQCWEKWKETNEIIKLRRQELGDLNYNHFRSKASDALNAAHHGDPREAKSKVKEIQHEMKDTQMSKPQFQEIHDLLDDAWQEATSRLQEKHEKWRDTMEAHIERWSQLIQKNESVISQIEAQIDQCQDMERNARSPEFADTVRGWIEDKYRKITDIRETNRTLEEKIRSAKSKVRS